MRQPHLAIAVTLVVAAAISSCGSDDSGDSAGDKRGGPELAIDERNGTVERVGLRHREARVERVFGPRAPRGAPPRGSLYPLEVGRAYQPTFPGNTSTPPGRLGRLRYRGVSFIAVAGEVRDVIVTSERGATRRGLRPGDAIERVEDLYPELDCGETNVASDFEAFVPACWGELKSGTHIWIGGDPIDNIHLASAPLRPSSG